MRLLVRAGVSLRHAKEAIDALVQGQQAVVTATYCPQDMRGRLARHNVSMAAISVEDVDVKALREELGVTQSEFAGRYALELKTVMNWEQHLAEPQGAARVLLTMIRRDPEAVVKILAK